MLSYGGNLLIPSMLDNNIYYKKTGYYNPKKTLKTYLQYFERVSRKKKLTTYLIPNTGHVFFYGLLKIHKNPHINKACKDSQNIMH